MDALKKPNAAGHDGDPNDVLAELGIEALQKLLDEARDLPSRDADDPGAGKTQTEADLEQRQKGEPPNEGETQSKSNRQEEEEQSKPNKFKLTRWPDIEPDLEEEDLVDGLIPSSGLILFYGPPSCGKSFLVSHLAMHIAAGLPYAGRDTEKAHVVYIASEGQKGFKKRVKAAREALGLKLTDDVWFSLITVTPNLGSDSGEVELLIKAIENEDVPSLGLIVVDTLSRSLCGADENGPGMAKFIENCGELSRRFNDAPVLPVHHTGWNEGRARGWSGLHAATDAEFAVVNKDGIRHVRNEKMKDGEEGLGWSFKLNQVEAGRSKKGKLRTTCVVDLLSDPATASKAEPGSSKAEDRRPLTGRKAQIYKTIQKAVLEGGEIPPACNHIPDHTKCVSRSLLARYIKAAGCEEGATDAARDRKRQRDIAGLAGDGWIGTWNELLWLT